MTLWNFLGTLRAYVFPPPDRAFWAGVGKTQTSYVSALPQQDSHREKPLYIPPQLVRAANGPIADTVEIALRYIEQLPEAFRQALPNYLLYDDLLDVLRDLSTGLQSVRNKIMPTDDELSALSGPSELLKEVADGLRRAIESEPLTIDTEQFIEANIASPLEAISRTFIADKIEGSLVMLWAQGIVENRARYPSPGEPTP